MPESITIVGAGPVGTLLALFLADSGYRVRLLERRADPRRAPPERGRSINLALAARGLAALERAGVLGRIRPEMIAMRGRQLHDRNGLGPLLPYGQRPEEVIYSISRARLNSALLDAASESPLIELQFNARAVAVDAGSGVITIGGDPNAEREPLTGCAPPVPLVIAADGAGSALRQTLGERGLLQASEAPLAHDYKELHIPALPNGSWALDPHALHVWPRGGFMLIALPNPDGSFTATLFLARAAAQPSHPGADQADPDTASFDALNTPARASAFFAAQFPDALALIPDFDAQFARHPQSPLATLYCWPWHVQRVLLIGDAAHAIVPFHGQGLNCGFEDCVLLSQLLGASRTPMPIDVPANLPTDPQADSRARHARHLAACAEFERLRRPNTDAIAAMAIENYHDMREAVLAPDFAERKRLALALERRFPQRFIPRYSMVMFHAEIPYAEALRRGALQENVLDALRAQGAEADSALAAQLLKDAGL